MNNGYNSGKEKVRDRGNLRTTSKGTKGIAPLKNLRQWVCWKYFESKSKDKPDKAPIEPHTLRYLKWSNRDNWLSYTEARELCDASADIDGVGFVATPDDPYTFLDFDDVIDHETGEIDPFVINVLEDLDSYAEWSPSGEGVRVVVTGRLSDRGGNYLFNNHKLEAYDSKHFLTITENVCLDAPIRDGQEFLDKIERISEATELGESDLPGLELQEERGIVRERVERILVKNDLNPIPVMTGSRKNTLLSYGAKVWHSEQMNESEFWKFLNEINATFLYNVDGEPEGLPIEELRRLYEANTKLSRRNSIYTVKKAIEEIQKSLLLMRLKTKGVQSTDWDIAFSLLEHGRKYGSFEENDIRIDCSWGTLKNISRTAGDQTISKSLKRLRKKGIRSVARDIDKGERTGHFLIDGGKLTGPTSWGLTKENMDSLLKLVNSKLGEEATSAQIYLQIEHSDYETYGYTTTSRHKVEFDMNNVASIVHTSWHRGIGPSFFNYLLALIILDGEARARDIAEITGRKPTSISGGMKKLLDLGVIHKSGRGMYEIADDLPQRVYTSRAESDEFLKDEESKHRVERRRMAYGYYRNLSAAKKRGDDLDLVGVPREMSKRDKDKVLKYMKERDWKRGD